MKHISIIVPAGSAVLSSIIGPYKIFSQVNTFLTLQGHAPLFQIDLVGIQDETVLYNDAFSIRPTAHIKDIQTTDLIVVTTIKGDIPLEIERNQPFIDWMKKMRAARGTEIASLCVGAFLLAETGLLDGKSCSTHWREQELFRKMYPQVNLLPEKIITEDNGLYSSGGGYSFLNLILHLIEKYAGKEMAILCSKLFEIDYERNNQNQFVIFKGSKDHTDQLIKDAQEFIEAHFSERLSVEQLSNQFALSRRNLVRRFKKATSNTPIEYIQQVKVEAAKRFFEHSNQTISEVMTAVGYNDVKAFRNIFRKHTGLTPIDYQAKYNRPIC